MSTQAQVYDFLKGIAHEPGHQVEMTPDVMAMQLGVSRDTVNKTLHNLMVRKRIDLVRAENGRTIIGFALLPEPADKRRAENRTEPRKPRGKNRLTNASVEKAGSRNGSHAAPVPRLRRVITPLLDDYATEKVLFADLTAKFGSRIEATFKEDPLAEEGLMLRERLDMVEAQLSEYRHRAEEAEHEASALRTRHMQAVTERANVAGAMVQHSDPND